MSEPLDTAEFLVRSEHRIRILELLDTASRTRDYLEETTGVSRVTLGRSLGEMEDRRWISREGKYYELRPLGAYVTENITTLLDAMGVQRELQDVVRYLPTDEIDFDLGHFADARITRPSKTDTMAPLKRSATVIRTASGRLRALVAAVDPIDAEAFWEYIEASDHTDEFIFTAGALETLRADEATAERARELADAKDGVHFRYDGAVPYSLTIDDETVLLELNDGSGFVPACIESDDEVVRSWAERTYERYKRNADQIGPEAFDA